MIQHLQSGGGLYFNPLGSYVKARQAAAAESSTKTTKKDDGLISDKLMLELQKNGIPVDVDNFMNKLADLEEDIDNGFGVNKRALYSLQAQANRIIQQADYLKKAEANAEKNEAFGEVAVGGRGELFVLNGTQLKTVLASQYNAEKDGPAMTVGELIEHRKFNPTQVGDTQLTRTIYDNLGMSKINEYLQKIVATVGSASNTDEAYIDLAGYVGKEAAKRPTGAQLESLQRMNTIMQRLGPDALFKLKNTAEGKNLEEGFNYIQMVLPRDMKTQLIGRNVAAGNKFETGGQYINNLIASALYSGNVTKNAEHISYEDSINRAAGTQAGNKEHNKNLKAIEVLTEGSLNKVDYHLTSSKNPNLSMTLHGTVSGALTNYDNNIIPKAPMSTAIESSIGPLIDKQHITMGSQKISESLFDTILYDGNEVINIWAPTDSNGDIDLNGLQTFNEILSYFDTDPALSLSDKNNILQQYGINGYINDQGQFVGTGNMAQFLVFTGITSDEVINEDDPFIDILDSDTKKFELDQIDRVYGYLNGQKKNKEGNLEFKKGWFDFTTDIIKAPVFMKLRSTAKTEVSTFANHGPLVNQPTYQELVTRDQLRYNNEHSQPVYQPSTQLLYGNE